MFEVKTTICPLRDCPCVGEWCPLFVPSTPDVKNPTAGDCMYALNQGAQLKVNTRVLGVIDALASDEVPGHVGGLGALAPMLSMIGGLTGKKSKGGKRG